jgi:hypothetical protein
MSNTIANTALTRETEVSESAPKLVSYIRHNKGKQPDLKSKLLDSTYMVASDPNSMRDQGMVRNCEYTYSATCA